MYTEGGCGGVVCEVRPHSNLASHFVFVNCTFNASNCNHINMEITVNYQYLVLS